MTQASSPASEPTQLPTIIIDPSLYEADAPRPKQSARAGLGRLARVTLLTGAVGGATVGLSHLLSGASISHDLDVASLTKLIRHVEHAAASRSALAGDPAVSLAQPAKSAAAAAPRAEDAVSAEAPPLAAAPGEGTAVEARGSAREQSMAEVAPEPLAAATSAAPLGQPLQPVARQALAGPGPLRAGTPRLDLETSIRNARRLQALNQLEEAEAAYLAVLAQHAEQSAALVGLARIKLALGQLDAALELAQRAALVAPGLPGVHLTLGDILRARGDQQAAQAEYALAK